MTSKPIAIIGGSGSAALFPDIDIMERIEISTPHGETSSPITRAEYHGRNILVLYRHGITHSIPPHKINYRANIWALASLAPVAVVALATVGGIRSDLAPGELMLPDQLIDYSWGRESTFFDGDDGTVGHLKMTSPYSRQVRELLLQAADRCGVPLADGGVYATTQGPRFETSAEVDRIERDGGDVVGMTGMPETALAAEKKLNYACVSIIVNPAAGRGDSDITARVISDSFDRGKQNLNRLIGEMLEIASDEYVSDSEVLGV